MDARAERSRLALITTGMQVLTKNTEATLKQIAEQANVGRATLYRQFDTRHALIKAIALHCIDVIEHATAAIDHEANSGKEAIRLLFVYTMPCTQELAFLMRLEEMAPNIPEIVTIYKKQQNDMLYIVRQAQKEGGIRRNVSAIWVVNVIEGLFYAAWLTQSQSKAPHAADTMAELMFNTLFDGVSGGD